MSEWGVVQKLVIEADTKTALLAACQIAFTEHSSGAESYEVRDGALHLFWADAEGAKLPFKLKTPEALYEFVSGWLAEAEPTDEQPDTDGTVKKGFRAEHDYGYLLLRIKPTWIVYGK